jgi:RND family efflux transporter MFP subunit
VEGQLLDLQVNVGDPVTKNQLIGQLDDSLLIVVVNQAKAELAALQSEVARAEAEVSRSRIQVEQAKLALQQANADADRLQALVVEGAISTQQAEQSQTAAETAAQALQAAEELVATEQQAVESARSRVSAQQAVIAAAEKRQSYAALIAPMTGVVLERLSEPGNLIRPGEEMIRLGDFSQIKVSAQISELDRAQVQVGQSVQVTLDAFPDLQLSGNVTRISPVADAAVRLVPVEITLPNPQNQVGSGLLARVTFAQTTSQRILVPNSALQTDPQGAKTVFVVQQEGENAKVTARSVQVGQAADGQVEILTGLQQGEVLVVRSGQPLQEGDLVKLSILSESQPGS